MAQRAAVAPAARPDAMRRHNLSLILEQVHRDGALTRAELTARLGLSRSTIGALVADLAELGLVEESVPSGGTRAGRPSHVVGPSAAGPYVLAVDVDVPDVTVAVIGLGGALLGRTTIELAAGDAPEPATLARKIGVAGRRVGEALGLTGGPVGMGVSVPGTVDRNTGVVGLAPNLGWRDVGFGALLRGLTTSRIPVVVGNDADLAVLAEHSRGNGRDCDDVVFLMGRTGVGAGIIVNGSALRGHDGHAGEIGHNVVDPAGPLCHCGKRGCLETYVSDSALLAAAGRGFADASEVFGAARAGHARATRAVLQIARPLGRAIAELVNVLNPELVLLGGSFGDVLDLARGEVETTFTTYVLDAPGETVALDRPALGADSALLGAAEIAFAALLEDPLGGRALSAR